MKTFIALFISSGLFSFAIALTYWFSSHNVTGTFFLGSMMLAFAWVVVYTKTAERESDLAGDAENAAPGDRAGEDVGIVTKQSAWPLLLALSIFIALIGVVWADFLLFAGFGGAMLCLWRLGAESARAGDKRIVTEEGEETVT